jgi:hypothetical protein
MKKFLFAGLLVASFVQASSAATIQSFPADKNDKSNAVVISGEIVDGDLEKFTNAIKKLNFNKPIMVLLDGPGGSFLEGIDIGRIINKQQMNTVAVGECASACAYIWLAGKRAIIDTDKQARVGFHSPYYVDKFGNKKSDNSASAILGAYLKEIGAGYGLIFYATSVDGDSIKWLTESSAKELGLYAEFYRSPKPQNEKNHTIDKARAEIAKTQEYNRIFAQQLQQIISSGQAGSANHIRIQQSMAQNVQYIKQQLEIINRLTK